MQDEIFARLKKSALVDRNGLAYPEFRKTLVPRWGLVWTHIALGWLALALVNLLIVVLSGRHLATDLILIAVGSILIGYAIAYLQLFLHEAAHYNLHPDRSINDILCNVFVSGVTGQEIKNYRPIHWDHHRFIGTPMDTEITYFDPLNIRFLVEALFGIRVLKVLLIRREKGRNRQTEKAGAVDKPGYGTVLGGLLFNLAYLSVLMYAHQWELAAAWTIGVLIVFPFFGAFRQMLEHRDELADPASDYTAVAHGAIHRLFGDGLIASTLGGAGFNRHLLHHWDLQVSYTRLPELERYLMGTEGAAYLREHQTSYWATFRNLLRPEWR